MRPDSRRLFADLLADGVLLLIQSLLFLLGDMATILAHAQRFLSSFGVVATFFRPGRHLLAAQHYREVMRRRFAQWRELTGLQPAI